VKRYLRILLAAVLLAAQQVALEHPLAHAFAAGGKSPLCEQHEALGTVLGGVDCPATHAVDEAPLPAEIAALLPAARDNAPLAPSSRGPPSLL
jgi:hypothetical protein